MGYTGFEINKIRPLLKRGMAVLDFGSQNLYTTQNEKPPFVSEWYRDNGINNYRCIDLAGDNLSEKLNWSYPLGKFQEVDLLLDVGSGEHSCQKEQYILQPFHSGYINSVYPKGHPSDDEIKKGFYYCWENKHNLLKLEGVMFNVNPLTGHWDNHCYSWMGENFYHEFVKIAGYELIETEVVCAMGNCESGKNVVGIIRKKSEQFPSFEEFYKHLPIYKS